MAARDRYTREIECPNCKEKGELYISEDDYPFMRNLHRSVDGTDGGFNAHMHDEYKIAVSYITCGEKFMV